MIDSRALGGTMREQRMLNQHLPRVIYHRVYSSVRNTSWPGVASACPVRGRCRTWNTQAGHGRIVAMAWVIFTAQVSITIQVCLPRAAADAELRLGDTDREKDVYEYKHHASPPKKSRLSNTLRGVPCPRCSLADTNLARWSASER